MTTFIPYKVEVFSNGNTEVTTPSGDTFHRSPSDAYNHYVAKIAMIDIDKSNRLEYLSCARVIESLKTSMREDK